MSASACVRMRVCMRECVHWSMHAHVYNCTHILYMYVSFDPCIYIYIYIYFSVVVEAQKCLCNIIYNSSGAQRICRLVFSHNNNNINNNSTGYNLH